MTQSPDSPATTDDTGEPGPTLVRTRGTRPAILAPAAALVVEAGPDRGRRCPLELQRTRAGTASSNHLVLTDPQVSRQHLELRVCDQGYLVRDLDSTNGTFYRGARLSEAILGPGAELRLGETTLRIEPGDEREVLVEARPALGSLVGGAPAMQQVYGLLAAVAPTDTTVLILGETGTGKELVAEELHRHSPRRDHSFVVVDCGAIPGSLIESELFGHVRGAFTGALSDQAGAFERAHGGTVFLDEVGELPLELQSRLLRVLDRRTIKRVGGTQYQAVDLRVVAATNRDLRRLVDDGQFRQDLYYRLGVVQIRVPPLRDRPEDIPLLARHFLWQSGCTDPGAVLTPEVLALLGTRKWRGNIRELRNVIERAAVLSDDVGLALAADPSLPAVAAAAPASPDHHHAWVVSPAILDRPYRLAKEELLRQFELLYLQRLVERHGDNISRIAAEAGIDRQMVRRLLRRHGLRSD